MAKLYPRREGPGGGCSVHSGTSEKNLGRRMALLSRDGDIRSGRLVRHPSELLPWLVPNEGRSWHTGPPFVSRFLGSAACSVVRHLPDGVERLIVAIRM